MSEYKQRLDKVIEISESKKEQKIRLEEKIKNVEEEIKKDEEILSELGLESVADAEKKINELEPSIQEKLTKIETIVNS